jgi:antitoxin component HigA of HigAB toxin-antitoxin module
MRKISKAELEKLRLLDREIQDEVHYEMALRAVRRLSPPVTDEGEAVEMPASVVALQQALFNRVQAYEKKEYPYGEPNFGPWAASRTDEDYQQKMAQMERAEVLVDKLEAFEQRRKARIRERLKATNRKQQDLAHILRKDKTYVSHLLAGRNPFTLEVVSRLHDTLGIPYEDLVPPAAAFEQTLP